MTWKILQMTQFVCFSLAKLPEESKLLTMDNDLQGTLDTQLVLKQSSLVKTDYIGWPIPTNKPLRSSGDTVDARGVLMVFDKSSIAMLHSD